MQKVKIDFRIADNQYDEIRKRAEAVGISTNKMARELVIESLKGDEKINICNSKNEIKKEISKDLIQLEGYIKDIPNSFRNKNLIFIIRKL